MVLTGFMGTGKTAVGRRLAARLGRELIDTDERIERSAGRSVREIFATEGEASFRERERQVVREIAASSPDAVVSTGGGTLLDDDNFAALREGSLLVCLTASPRTLARRLRGTVADRPLLQGPASLSERITELLEARAQRYARVPFQIDTSSLTVEQVVDAIVAELERVESAARAQSAAGKA